MRRLHCLALMIHHSRLEEAIDLLKSHTAEISTFELMYGGEDVEVIQSACHIKLTLFTSNYRFWDQKILEMIDQNTLKGVIFLGDPEGELETNPVLMKLLQKCFELDVPLAFNLSMSEALIHLLAEHPEAISGHHLAAQYLEDIAYRQ